MVGCRPLHHPPQPLFQFLIGPLGCPLPIEWEGFRRSVRSDFCRLLSRGSSPDSRGRSGSHSPPPRPPCTCQSARVPGEEGGECHLGAGRGLGGMWLGGGYCNTVRWRAPGEASRSFRRIAYTMLRCSCTPPHRRKGERPAGTASEGGGGGGAYCHRGGVSLRAQPPGPVVLLVPALFQKELQQGTPQARREMIVQRLQKTRRFNRFFPIQFFTMRDTEQKKNHGSIPQKIKNE